MCVTLLSLRETRSTIPLKRAIDSAKERTQVPEQQELQQRGDASAASSSYAQLPADERCSGNNSEASMVADDGGGEQVAADQV